MKQEVALLVVILLAICVGQCYGTDIDKTPEQQELSTNNTDSTVKQPPETTGEYDRVTMKRLRNMRYAVTDSTSADSKAGVRAIKKFQSSVGLPETGRIDTITAICALLEEREYKLKKKGDLIEIELDQESYAGIRKFPGDSLWFTSRKNPVKTQKDIQVGLVVASWPGSVFLLQNRADNGLFANSQVKVVGDAYFESLFTMPNPPNLFLTNFNYAPDKPIIGSGGGIAVKFIPRKTRKSGK